MYTTRSSLIKQLKQSPSGRKILYVIQKIVAVVKYLYSFVRSHKNMMTVMIPIAIAAVGLCIYFIVRTVLLHYDFANNPDTLLHTSAYNTNTVSWFDQKYDIIPDAIAWLQTLTTTVDRYQTYVQSLQTPYTHFLQHRLLPSLFIRKNPYTDQLDTTIVWRRFINENPFTDTALIQYWSDFFRNVGDGTDYILIKDMQLWTITEWEELFTIPITVSFVAPSKRAFLLLVDKLSLTSQEATISLINQFFYHMRIAIEDTIEEEHDNMDQYIGNYLYEWAFNNGPGDLITTDVITQAIEETAQCQLLNTQACLYTFRSVYRSIPQLAYGVGLRVDQDAINALKRFIQTLPPVITVADFNFQRKPSSVWSIPEYEWSVMIHMHGKSVQQENVDQVAFVLGEQCLGNNIFLSPQTAADVVDQYLRRVADTQIAQQQSTQLLQLSRLINEDKELFVRLSNYQKVIKLFELHRMLDDAGICN